MENEVGQFALVYWKKQLGKPLQPEEEKIWMKWLLTQNQEISWKELEAELLLEAEMRSFTDENVKQFQDEFEIRYGLTISEKESSSVFPYRYTWLWKAAVVLCLLGIGHYFLTKSSDVGKAFSQVGVVKHIPLPKDSGIVLINEKQTRIPIQLFAGDRIISHEGALGTRLYEDSLFYERLSFSNRTDTGYHTIVVPAGKQLWVVLPDGTRACINANSSIRIPLYYAQVNRDISVDGDCFLNVAQMQQMPFSVLTEKMIIKATGTHFNIDTRRDQKFQQVTLLSGHIKIFRFNDSIEIREGQIVNVFQDTIQRYRNEFLVSAIVRRESSEFNYDSIEAGRLIKEIADWYGLIVDNPAPLNIHKKIHLMSISKLGPVEKVLEAIARHINIRFTIQGNMLLVKSFSL